ncbi:hypothetical protein GCM10009658_48150 [Planotetraspora silvatica]
MTVSAALELAQQAVKRLEESVARVAGARGGPEHASALVLAGSASVLLGQVELTVAGGETTTRAAAAALRSRYDDALLRLGAVPPPVPAPPIAGWVQIGPAQWAPVGAPPPGAMPPYAMPPYAVPPGAMPPYAMPPYAVPPGAMPPGAVPGHPAPPAHAVPPGRPVPAGNPVPPGYPVPPGHQLPPGFALPPGYPPPPGYPGPVPHPMYLMPATGLPVGVGYPGYPPRRRTLREVVAGLPSELRVLGRFAVNALTVMGALLVAFSLYASWFGHLAYDRNQRIMVDRLNENFKVAAAIAAAPVEGDRDLAALPPRGEPVALLEIPRIGVREAVVQGTGTSELREAVGHYRPSPMPGQIGNAILAGHRNLYGAPLARIAALKPGDKVIATTQEGRFSYTVERTLRAKTGEQDFVSQATIVNRLTLLTTSDTSTGGRLAVIARLDGQPASLKTLDDHGLKVDELGLGRDPSAWWPVLGWGGLFFVLLTGTFLLYRRWRRVSTYLITTPALLALALVWFEALARLIPSTY